MSNQRDKFYLLRDQRTVEYGIPDCFDVPVTFGIGSGAATTEAGQITLLALVNQLARIHRTIRFCVPRESLIAKSLVPAGNLRDAVQGTAIAIDPFINIEPVAGEIPPNCISVEGATGIPWYIGASGAVGILAKEPTGFDGDGLSLGACLASSLGANAALRSVLGQHVVPTRLSAWDLTEGPSASRGPMINGPLDIGNVIQVGAGGVGLCFDYWVWQRGVTGSWAIVDKDVAELHNTNRALALTALDAGWPNTEARNKAEVAAGLLHVTPVNNWFDGWDETFRPDVVLALANEHGVRHSISLRGEPILLHASTASTWEAQVHRHIPDRDDCINCRLPERAVAHFKCAQAHLDVPASGASSDAALPFLSAAAGLLLLSKLYQLQYGEIARTDENFWSIHFNTARKYSQTGRWSCTSNCRAKLPPCTRFRLHQGSKWSHIDVVASKSD